MPPFFMCYVHGLFHKTRPTRELRPPCLLWAEVHGERCRSADRWGHSHRCRGGGAKGDPKLPSNHCGKKGNLTGAKRKEWGNGSKLDLMEYEHIFHIPLSRYPIHCPLVVCYIAIENGPFSLLIYLLKMVIFHSKRLVYLRVLLLVLNVGNGGCWDDYQIVMD